MQGKIIKQLSNDYTVKIDNELIVCKARGKFRNMGITPLVGDNVLVDVNNKYIVEILERKNSLIRPAIANITQAIIVTSVEVPAFSANLLDKLLCVIECNKIKPIIYISKLDIIKESDKEFIMQNIKYYKQIGYEVYTSPDDIKKVLKDQITVLTGQSGAGKSTLLNKIDSNLNLNVDAVSYALGRGKHTTRHTELMEVCGGLIADTPGFSALDLSSMSKTDIRDSFIEFDNYKDLCEYSDCMHILEDNCEVKRQLQNGNILKSRYDDYINFINKR